MPAPPWLATVVALSLTALLPAVPASGAAPAPDAGRCQGAARSDLSLGAQERVMECLVNRERVSRGLRPVRRDPRLARSATAKTVSMLRCDDFSHTPCGTPFSTTFRRARYAGRSYGENIAWGTGRLGTPAAIIRAWMRSPGHRRNILGAAWRHIGVDVRRARSFQGQAGAAVWTAQFGRP